MTLDTPPSLGGSQFFSFFFWLSVFSSLARKMVQIVKISEFSAKDHRGSVWICLLTLP